MKISVEKREGGQLAVGIRGHEVLVDQPDEGEGSDTGPTPTELFVGGLAACVAYYAEIFLRRHNILTDNFRVECDFAMSSDRPTRVESIDLRVPVPEGFEAQWHDPLQRVLEHCAVHNSLRQAPTVRIRVVESGTA